MRLVLKLDVTPEELGQITAAWKKSGLRQLDDLVLQLLQEHAEKTTPKEKVE